MEQRDFYVKSRLSSLQLSERQRLETARDQIFLSRSLEGGGDNNILTH